MNEQQREKHIAGISELEFKIYGVLKIGGVVNPELCLHNDFPKVWNFFKDKL